MKIQRSGEMKERQSQLLFTERRFKKYVEAYSPFPWEGNKNDPRPSFRNKHFLLESFGRYLKVFQYFEAFQRNRVVKSIIDVGPYPGVIARLIKDFGNSEIEYFGVGLHFDDEYQKAMDRLGARLFATDLDPEFVEAKECKEWPINNADACFFLDVIEHLVNPIYCLDQINKSLKMRGRLILTTDNISSFAAVYRMMRKGKSPNVHPLQSSVFYRGEWRPHFKEFSKDHLFFYLQHCGFEVVKHEYFERKQGAYNFDENGRIYEKSKYLGTKIGALRKPIVRYFPHLRDHQIILAEKQTEYEVNALKRPAVTYSRDEWMKLRTEAKVF